MGSAWTIETLIEASQGDARVINIAGRQRMLSQKISKEALRIMHAPQTSVQNLRDAVATWTDSHEALVRWSQGIDFESRASDEIITAYQELYPTYDKCVSLLRRL